MRLWTSVFQSLFSIYMLFCSVIMKRIEALKMSAEEVEKSKRRREQPSEEQMLWCWKHRGIW